MSDTIFVTGGAGFIGSHTCKALSRAGYTPVVYDDMKRGNLAAVRWGPHEVGDLRDTDHLTACLKKHAPRAVIHFAALAYVGESNDIPLTYFDNNVSGTVSLLTAMAASGVDRLVFSSSCATYGVPDTLPITETTPQQPINPYGQTKLMCEQIIRDTATAGPLQAIALRYFNAAGADPEGEIGEDHDPETHIIPLMLGAALAGPNRPVHLFGTDHPTPDGTCIRDFIHVSDLAQAHVLALDAFVQDFEAMNLGTGSGVSLRELIALCANVTNRPVPVVEAERRPGDPAALVADPRLAMSRLGWQPRHSDIATILRTAHAWMVRG